MSSIKSMTPWKLPLSCTRTGKHQQYGVPVMITMLGEGDGRRATVDLSVHYLAPANGDLVATATIRRSGGRIATIDIELESEGVLAALGRATFMIIRPQGSG